MIVAARRSGQLPGASVARYTRRVDGGRTTGPEGLALWAVRAAFVMAMAGTAWFAFTPVTVPGVERVWDKLQHVAAFFVLAWLLDLSLQGRARTLQAGALIAWGAAIEAVQHTLPYRHASMADLFADVVGVAAYLAIAAASRRLRA